MRPAVPAELLLLPPRENRCALCLERRTLHGLERGLEEEAQKQLLRKRKLSLFRSAVSQLSSPQNLDPLYPTCPSPSPLDSQVPAPRPAGPPGAGRGANNKKKNKSKTQRKADQQSREGKKLDKEASAEVERRRRDPSDPNNTLILNYSRWEGDKRTQMDGKQAATKRT